MSITAIADEGAFKALSASAGGALVVVHFHADWAPQCKQMSEVMGELAKEHSAVRFAEVEAENVPELSEQFEVTAVPTVVLLKRGKLVERVNGANAPELAKKVKANAAVAQDVVLPATASAPKEDLNDKLRRLINAAPVMLFMKGTADEPQCGFSRSIVALLKEQNAEFSTFNILADDQVRQGLKTFSNWPTFPQLYVGGELIGGLDIVKEMAESGELKEVLPKPKTQDELNKKLHDLTHRSKVILFMKGTPETPRCGFSRTMVSLLQEEKVDFDYYDILGDDEVRQGLKTYSNWPTFPQLYVKGELLGGLDIIKEMRESGELAEALQE